MYEKVPPSHNDETIVVSACCIEAKGNKRRRVNPPAVAECIAIIAEPCSCYVGGKHGELLIFPPVDFGASWMSSGKSGVVLQQEMLLEYDADLVVEEEEEQSFESDEPAVEPHTELAEDTGEHGPTSDETLLGSGYRSEPQGRIIRFSLRVRATK